MNIGIKNILDNNTKCCFSFFVSKWSAFVYLVDFPLIIFFIDLIEFFIKALSKNTIKQIYLNGTSLISLS